MIPINCRNYINEKSTQLNLLYRDKNESKTVCEYLLMHHLKCNRIALSFPSTRLIEKELFKKIEHDILQLMNNVPLQYIINEAPFGDLILNVNRGVLIPRQETEELIACVEKNEDLSRPINVLDACTGSGCIAIALKHKYPNLILGAFDEDETALKTAKQNAEKYQADIHFFQYDLLNNNDKLNLKADIIVSNPPYVLESEKQEISERVLRHEPHKALFVSNDNPLLFYKQIISKFGTKNCHLYFEINPLVVDDWEKYLNEKKLKHQLLKDMNNKYRFVYIEM